MVQQVNCLHVRMCTVYVLPTCMCVHHAHTWPLRGRKILDLLEVELEMVVSHPVVLGIKSRSSPKAASALTL